ncbi:MAG: hypothetical protein ABI165_06825, partial [Bryobacteraceae bacterium]
MKFVVAICALALTLTAQSTTSYAIQAAAGVVRQVGDAGPATAALLWEPRSVAPDGTGGFFIADTADGRLRDVSAAGIITTIANIAFPAGTARSAAGDVYVADAAGNQVRKVSASGTVTIAAGNGKAGYSGDGGAATQAQLSFPLGVAIDAAGNLYIADTNNSAIRRVTPDGRISTVAGHGVVGFGGDGNLAVQALLAYPRGVTADAAGNFYIADTLNNRIRKVTGDGVIATVAGRNRPAYDGDNGPAIQAALDLPSAVAVDAAGDLYIADTGNDALREVRIDGTIRTVAGNGAPGFVGDNGPAAQAQLNAPQGVGVDASGNVLIADTENNRIRRVNAQGVIQTVAGSDPSNGDRGPALAARLFQPSGVAFDAAGNLYIAETGSHRVRKVSPQGVISTFAGTGVAGDSGDGGNAAAAQLNGPNGLAVDRAGNIYIADTGNNAVRMVTAGGAISTVAGTGAAGNSGDGSSAVQAELFNPNAVAVDGAGNVYIADSANNRVRKIGADGIIRNFAGDGQHGLPGFAGDG